jgi:uncharacterized membrane-anchored protein YitT (DUF2179 family)
MTKIYQVPAIVAGSALIAAGFNLMLIPHQLLSGGLSGISMLIGYLTQGNIAALYLLLNLPVLVWGWFAIGRHFIVLSVISVLLTSWFMALLPERAINEDPLLGAVFGGAVVGLGTGMSLRAGGSTGGFDIIGSIVTRNRDVPLGMLLFLLNAAVIIALGYLKHNWDLALYSMLAIFVAGKVIDTVHIRHLKVTAFIVTGHKNEMLERLLRHPRGVTVIKTEGAFSHQEKDMLMTVTTRYELAELTKIVRETDPKAFMNVVKTVGVIGEFRRNR